MNQKFNQIEKESITIINVIFYVTLAIITVVAGYGLAVILMSF